MNSETERFTKWFTDFGNAWAALDYQKAVNLFSKDVEYYESAVDKPCANWDVVLNLWSVVPKNQKNVKFSFELLATTENTSVANWKVVRTLVPSNIKQTIDGIFVVKLNGRGLCNYFKQWRAVK